MYRLPEFLGDDEHLRSEVVIIHESLLIYVIALHCLFEWYPSVSPGKLTVLCIVRLYSNR